MVEALMRSENDLLPPRYLQPTRIGYGGMGEIFRAEDEVLGRTVAIKLLSDQYARDESLRARFTREALAAARLSGEPGTVTIFDVGEWEGRPFIVMEYLGGGSRSEEHTSELQSHVNLVCRLLLEKKKKKANKLFQRDKKNQKINQK